MYGYSVYENKIASQSHDNDHMIRSHDLRVHANYNNYYGPTCTSHIIIKNWNFFSNLDHL